MSATKAVADLLRSELDWRRFFKQCCELGPFRLRRAGAKQFREELEARGSRYSAEEIQDALLLFARQVFPDSRAGRWREGVAGSWRDHDLDCECIDCSAALPKYVQLVRTEEEVFEVARQHLSRSEKGGAA